MIINYSGKIPNNMKNKIETGLSMCEKSLKFKCKTAISVSMISETKMQALNRKERNINKPTDVLSFPSVKLKAGTKVELKKYLDSLYEPDCAFLGDVVLCREVIERQWKNFSESIDDEVLGLCIHSLLHLIGYDHIKDSDAEIMEPLQNELCRIVGIFK